MSGSFEVFPWSHNFETGLVLLDMQHQRLVQLLNILAARLVYQADLSVLDGVFDELTG